MTCVAATPCRSGPAEWPPTIRLRPVDYHAAPREEAMSRDEALAAGADAFLQKPLEPLKLVSTVKDLLGASAYLR